MDYTTAEGAQGICPVGWHVPTDAEQHTLDDYLATTGTCDPARSTWDCDPAGTKMSLYTLNGDNASGFSALLVGYRYTDGSFNFQSTYTFLWSSTESDTNAWLRYLDSGTSTVRRVAFDKAHGVSVRCVQD